MEILNVIWFCGRTNVGIVKVQLDGEVKFFIAAVPGLDEQADMEFIAQWGSTFPYTAGVQLLGG